MPARRGSCRFCGLTRDKRGLTNHERFCAYRGDAPLTPLDSTPKLSPVERVAALREAQARSAAMKTHAMTTRGSGRGEDGGSRAEKVDGGVCVGGPTPPLGPHCRLVPPPPAGSGGGDGGAHLPWQHETDATGGGGGGSGSHAHHQVTTPRTLPAPVPLSTPAAMRMAAASQTAAAARGMGMQMSSGAFAAPPLAAATAASPPSMSLTLQQQARYMDSNMYTHPTSMITPRGWFTSPRAYAQQPPTAQHYGGGGGGMLHPMAASGGGGYSAPPPPPSHLTAAHHHHPQPSPSYASCAPSAYDHSLAMMLHAHGRLDAPWMMLPPHATGGGGGMMMADCAPMQSVSAAMFAPPPLAATHMSMLPVQYQGSGHGMASAYAAAMGMHMGTTAMQPHAVDMTMTGAASVGAHRFTQAHPTVSAALSSMLPPAPMAATNAPHSLPAHLSMSPALPVVSVGGGGGGITGEGAPA